MVKLRLSTREIKCILKTLGTDKGKPAFANVYYDEGFLYASNGYTAIKLNLKNNLGLESLENCGVYKIISVVKADKVNNDVILDKVDTEYPDIKGIYAAIKPSISSEGFTIDVSDNMSISGTIIKLYQKTTNAYNYDRIKQFTVYSGIWAVAPQGVDKAVILQADDIQALILPFKL